MASSDMSGMGDRKLLVAVYHPLAARAELVFASAYVVAAMAERFAATEIGRQPWLVTGVLRTADAVSATPAPIVGLSLSAYLVIYLVLLAAYVSVLFHLARKSGATTAPPITAARGEPDES